MKKPLIVVSAAFRKKEEVSVSPLYLRTVDNAYTRAVSEAGGVPLLACGGDYAALAGCADALLMTGGVDVSPALYGSEAVNDTVICDPYRDADEKLLLGAFLAAGKPVFGICRGIQFINVFLGGTLIQDIPSQSPSELVHRGGKHPVTADPGSLLYTLFGSQFRTNSGHHQSVLTPGKGLTVTARASDGFTEAVECRARHIYAVQFHPERMTGPWRPDDLPETAPLFREWIRIAAEYIH